MSNLIQNGDIFYPTIFTDVQYYTNFVQGQREMLVWVGSDLLSIQNNDNGVTSFGYPDVTLLNNESLYLYQYISFENNAFIYQPITITKIGKYSLSFLYVSRPNFVHNSLQIFVNNVLLDVITTSQANWTQYTYSFPILATGTYTLLFQGQPGDTDTNIAVTNVKLIEPPSIIGTGVPTIYNNTFRSTVIKGSFGVIDYIDISANKKTLGTITTNYLICNNNLTMPADGTQSIYFKDISSNIIGRIFGNKKQFFCDYHDILSFRYCTGAANTLQGTTLNLGSTGIIVNSTFSSSTYNLDVYGNGGAYIRGPLKVQGDITYQDTTTLTSVFSGYNIRINSISGNVYTFNSYVNTLSGNIYTLSGRFNTLNSYFNTISSNVYTISGRLNTLSETVNTLSTTVAGQTTSINTINSAATYSAASILANGFVQATNFKLTNPSNYIYRVGPTTTQALTSASAYTYNYNALPVGLYIANYQINLINTNTVNGTYNITECRSQITNTTTATVIYADTDITTHGVPRASLQTYLGMTIINNTSVQNYQFYLITYFTGTYQILSGTASNSTFLQFTKIG